MLVFSTMTAVLDSAEDVLGWLGMRFARLDGSTKASERGPLLDAFCSDSDVRAMCNLESCELYEQQSHDSSLRRGWPRDSTRCL